jgi:hypothetical protein
VKTSGQEIEHIYPTTTIWRKMSRYREITVDVLPWLNIQGKEVSTRTHHRPLSWYFRALRVAGLVVAVLEEPGPTEEFLTSSPQGAWIAETPLHCVIKAWKLKE